MTTGENALLEQLKILITKAKTIGSIWGGWGVHREVRDGLRTLANQASLYLTPPKLELIGGEIGNLSGLMDQWRSAGLSRSKIETRTIDKLKYIKNLVGLDPAQVVTEVKKEVIVEKVVEKIVERQPELPVEQVRAEVKAKVDVAVPTPKKFPTALVAGGVAVLAGLYFFVFRKK